MRARNLYQLYDREAGMIAGPVLAAINDREAIRTFNTLLSNKDILPGQHPEQFEMRLVAQQNEETGEIVQETDSRTGYPLPLTIQTVATGRQWLESQQRSAAQRENGSGTSPLTL